MVVLETEKEFFGAVIRGKRFRALESADKEIFIEGSDKPLGQIGHLGERGSILFIKPAKQLSGVISRFSPENRVSAQVFEAEVADVFFNGFHTRHSIIDTV